MTISGPQFLALEWSWVVLTLILVLTRYRIRYNRRKGLNICDTFVGIGWLFYLVQACCDIVLLKKGYFDNKINSSASNFGPEYGLATREDTIIALKVIYTETCLYYTTMYMAKFAMIFLYYEIIPPHMKPLRWATHITFALSIIGGASTTLMKVFWCHPISSNWAVDGQHCANLTSLFTSVYKWTFHILTDCLIYIIPIFIVRNLKMPLSQKIGVALTFSSGFLCIVFANLVQLSVVVMPTPIAQSWTYSAAEMAWAVIICCLPSLKPLLSCGMRRKKNPMMVMYSERTPKRSAKSKDLTSVSVTRMIEDDDMASAGGSPAYALDVRESGRGESGSVERLPV